MRPERQAARRLRQAGKSYNDISRLLSVPKSTRSGWFQDLRLSRRARQRLMTRTQQHWAESLIRYNKQRVGLARQRTEGHLAQAAKEIGMLTPRELQLVGTALYWAEGSKRSRWELRFCNADPTMVRLMMRFLREACRIPEPRMTARIHLHPYISEPRAERYWSEVTGIPPHRFRRPQRVLNRSSQGKRPHRRLPYGTFHLRVSGGHVRNHVMGWIEGLRQSLDYPVIDRTPGDVAQEVIS